MLIGRGEGSTLAEMLVDLPLISLCPDSAPWRLFCSASARAMDTLIEHMQDKERDTYVVALWVACVGVGVTVTCTKYVVVYV